MSRPVLIISGICYRSNAAFCLVKGSSRHNILHRVICILHVSMEVQNFFEHRDQIAHVSLLSCVFLRNLNLQHLIGFGKASKKRMHRLPYLKIHRPVLNLQDHIIQKGSVKSDEIVISGSGPVCLPVAPVLSTVIYKASPNDQSPIWLYCLCKHIGAVCMGSVISERSRTAFRIRLNQESPQIRNRFKDHFHFSLPPGSYTIVQRICAVKL